MVKKNRTDALALGLIDKSQQELAKLISAHYHFIKYDTSDPN